jgi:lysophospholipase L1-like esterase
MATMATPYPLLSKKKKLYFRLFALGLPFFCFFFLELVFRLLGIGRAPLEDPYILLYSPSSIFKRVKQEGEVFLRVYREELYSTRNIQFPAKKPQGKTRIFCVGGSASAGWPHQSAHAYSTYLAEALKHVYPQKDFEVLNLSGHAFGSNRVRLIFEELLEFEPDLLILYSGNNEFLEERFYKKPTATSRRIHQIGNLLRLSRIYSWVEGKILKEIEPSTALDANRKSKNKESIESKIFQRELELRRDPEQFEQLLQHYRFNIEKMIESAQAKKIPVCVLSVPVNLKNWIPNVSAHPESFKALESWTSLYHRVRLALLHKEKEAVSLGEQLVAQDPHYAESHFRLGQAYEEAKDFVKAREAFLNAVDLDYNPFRALRSINTILRETSQRFNVLFFDAEESFAQASHSKGCPGDELFLDYVHPTVQGNLLLARGLIACLAPLFGKGQTLPEHFVPGLEHYQESQDQGVQHSVIFLCGMMHQYEKMIHLSRAFLPVAQESSKTFVEEVLKVFVPYVHLQYQSYRGEPISEKEQEILKEAYQNFYEKYYNVRYPPRPQKSPQ